MPNLRCPTCHHVYAIHDANGACPRWALPQLHTGTRVCIRIGAKWPGTERHTLVYFADCVDDDAGIVLAWDLTADTKFEAPVMTVRAPWTRVPNNTERADAVDEVKQRLGERVNVLRNLS